LYQELCYALDMCNLSESSEKSTGVHIVEAKELTST